MSRARAIRSDARLSRAEDYRSPSKFFKREIRGKEIREKIECKSFYFTLFYLYIIYIERERDTV